MARRTELGEVLFPVRMEPLFVRLGGRDVRVPDSQAVVHAQAGRVLGVVGREYRLVSHREALDLAMACAHEAFPETRPGEWQVAAVDAPATGSCCFIDLRHNTGALDFQGLPGSAKPEVYGPFVRVTSSAANPALQGSSLPTFFGELVTIDPSVKQRQSSPQRLPSWIAIVSPSKEATEPGHLAQVALYGQGLKLDVAFGT